MEQVTKIEFDGIQVRLLNAAGQTIAHSFAVSGNPFLQSPSFSNLKNTGPLPEGSYTILQSNIG